MALDPNAIPVTIVSTDRRLLKETAWTLAAFGYRAVASNDWSEEAAWSQSTLPGVQLLDLRAIDAGEPAALVAGRPAYTYRIAICEQHADADDALLARVDDVIACPISTGELLSRVRTGVRRLEFERRHAQLSTSHAAHGLLSRRGLLSAMGAEAAPSGVLALFGVDFYEVIVHEHGQHAADRLISTLDRRLHTALGGDSDPALVAPGVLAVLLPGNDLAQGRMAAEVVLRDFASSETVARETRSCPSLSATLVAWGPDGPTEELLLRCEEALEHSSSFGGGQIVDVDAVEDEVEAWRERVDNGALLANVSAQHVMTPLPLTTTQVTLTDRLEELRNAAAAGQTLPDCVPVLDDDGVVTAVLDLALLQRQSNGAAPPTDSELVSADFHSVAGGLALVDVLNAFSEHQTETLLVVEQGCPIGYITCNALTELYTAAVDASTYRGRGPLTGVRGLAVPVAQPDQLSAACQEQPTACEAAV